jgi:hypothetical protein
MLKENSNITINQILQILQTKLKTPNPRFTDWFYEFARVVLCIRGSPEGVSEANMC